MTSVYIYFCGFLLDNPVLHSRKIKDVITRCLLIKSILFSLFTETNARTWGYWNRIKSRASHPVKHVKWCKQSVRMSCYTCIGIYCTTLSGKLWEWINTLFMREFRLIKRICIIISTYYIKVECRMRYNNFHKIFNHHTHLQARI